MAVACVLRIVRGQDADVAGPYLAARRACRSADRRLGDPGGRAAEAGRPWLHPLFAADVTGSVGAPRLAGLWPVDGRGGLYLARRARANRQEEVDRLFVRRPHVVPNPSEERRYGKKGSR